MTTKRNILVFMGTRPEAVKLAPVVAALRSSTDFHCTVVATGQHKEMFRQVADTFGFAVDANLDVMRPNQTLAGLTARLLHGIDGWLETAQPDMALVQGDTTTVLAASLACFYRGVAHRQHLVALPGGGEPQARHAAGRASLRADRGRARSPSP
jgi:UDP-N-acetylglucosamine 2-epimerase (non-hydrolysing)